MKKIKLGTLGMIDMAAGMLLMVLGKILPGLILLLIGLCAVAMHYTTLMRGMGLTRNRACITAWAARANSSPKQWTPICPNRENRPLGSGRK